MPALVKSRFGASGSRDDEGTMVCFFSRKKSRNDCLICAEVINQKLSATFLGMRELLQLHSEAAARPAPEKRAVPCLFRDLHLRRLRCFHSESDPINAGSGDSSNKAINSS